MSERDSRMDQLMDFFCEGMEGLPSAMAGGGAKGRAFSRSYDCGSTACTGAPVEDVKPSTPYCRECGKPDTHWSCATMNLPSTKTIR